MSHPFELQSVFRNPQADEETIHAEVRDALELQNECQRLVLDCRIPIGRVLTPEQLRNWCTQTGWFFP